MTHSLPSISKTLEESKFPYLRPCSFACITRTRTSTGPVTAAELDLVLDALGDQLDFPGTLIPGKQIVTEWPEDPKEEDFETTAAFDQAYDKFWPKRFDPKPWLVRRAEVDVKKEVLDGLKWSINNKAYPLQGADGKIVHVAYSRQPDEKRVIAEQEQQHQGMVNEFALNASRLFAEDGCVTLYYSNHQLELGPDESVAECYEGCFFDRTIAFASGARILMIWIGHLRWYG